MRYNNEQKIKEAERLYCGEKLSGVAIAKILKCNAKSVYSWRAKYNWGSTGKYFTDEEKDSILQNFYHISQSNIRISLINKFTRNNSCYYLQCDIYDMLIDICYIKETALRIKLAEQLTTNQPE